NSLFYYKVGETMYSHESKGVSLKDTNNETVNVVAALSGKVASVKDEILKGTVVTIEHENGVETVYTGVYNVNVEAGEEVEQGTVLGTTGLSQLEPDSGNVIHFEVLKDEVKVNPETVIDKKLGDL
ncbi:MAG: M23 family metallopeptidase, partial [Turicibacter sp.]|nr:M23 family metallopeptidase [Turicibacter sp.]